MTVLVMSIALLLAVVLNYLIPEKVFMIIASIATFATVWVWLMILLSQIVMRRTLSPEETRQLSFPVPWWPVAPALATAFMAFVIGLLGYFEEPHRAVRRAGVDRFTHRGLLAVGAQERRRLAGERGNAADVTLASDKTRCGGFFIVPTPAQYPLQIHGVADRIYTLLAVNLQRLAIGR